MFAPHQTIKKVFAELFSKSDRGYGASSPVFTISFLQPGFPETSGAEFWGFAELFSLRYLAKEKSVTKGKLSFDTKAL